MHRKRIASACVFAFFAFFQFSPKSLAQFSSTQQAATTPESVAIPTYPDSSSGLEHLVKDIMKAQRENQAALAENLLKSMVLPEPREWYDQVFGQDISKATESIYERSGAEVPRVLARFFLDATAKEMTDVRAVRFDKSCDDNAGEDTFGILHARINPVPLYAVRLFRGNNFLTLFAFAFVDGGFRFILTPKLEGSVFGPASVNPSAKGGSGQTTENKIQRVAVGGNVQAARLIHRVQPTYPGIAREEHLQGTVTLHALIAKDGSLSHLYVIKGYCSLSQAALEAVRQWRYTPTLLMGNPVEVDTTIQVIYSLSW